MEQARRPAPENRYYAMGEERSAKVHLLFARIAPRYDCINDLMSWGMHRRWKRRLTALALPRPGEKALDLCCGTGDVARSLARSPEGSGRLEVMGVDFSEEMLEIARKNSPPGLPVSFRRADALSLPFPDASFEVVTCAYGLRNLADLDRGLREVWRVLRPGGRLACLEFGRPARRILSALYFAYLRLALPVFGMLFLGDSHSYGYIFASVSRFPGQRELAERMGAAGFESVDVHDLMGGAMAICVARKGRGTVPGSEA
ncbi:MAG: bifunctional demethylmenaquinone methyltransferase/2-methoxy-6-polyprenyl-1,4-benzoquinol methylase UbiE [Acidobacteria bacterium]|nr:MAG: bifunctional demethylmenaquinone methyltransferase/2-methoxy-6-polyprenyl-1,4-benzoquinol methylase UbiE [Acidobacteriota bacterium]